VLAVVKLFVASLVCRAQSQAQTSRFAGLPPPHARRVVPRSRGALDPGPWMRTACAARDGRNDQRADDRLLYGLREAAAGKDGLTHRQDEDAEDVRFTIA
jgi:hypothetical protein